VGTAMGMDLDYYRNVQVTQMPYGQSLSILALAEMLYEYI
jgi:unsaturated rhamnogalacturonyl hydrolase